MSAGGQDNLSVGPLPTTGTYTLLFQQTYPAQPFNAVTFSISLTAPAPTALTVGTPKLVSVSNGSAIGGTFAGTSGQYYAVTLSESSSSVAVGTISILDPAGAVLASVPFAPNCYPTTCTGSKTVNVGPVATTGTYTVLFQQGLQPSGDGSGSLTIAVANSTAGTGNTANLSTSVAGQAKTFTFTGAADQSFAVAITNLVFTPNTVSYAYLSATAPDGSGLNSVICYAPSCELSLPLLTQSGTYTVSLTPAGSATMAFTETVSPDVTAALTPGTAVNLNLATLGQCAVLTFQGIPGQLVDLTANSVATVPAGNYMFFSIYDPHGNVFGNFNAATGSSYQPTIVIPGTYTVIVSPYSTPVASTMQFTMAPVVAGTAPTNGTPTNFSTTLPGEDIAFTFAGVTGQDVNIALS